MADKTTLTIGEALKRGFGLCWTSPGVVGLGVLTEAAAIILSVLYALAHIVIGVIGYRLWMSPTRKMINVTFIAGLILAALTLSSITSSGVNIESGHVLLIIDNYKLGLLPPRRG